MQSTSAGHTVKGRSSADGQTEHDDVRQNKLIVAVITYSLYISIHGYIYMWLVSEVFRENIRPILFE